MNRRSFLLLSALAPLSASSISSDVFLSADEWEILLVLHSRLNRIKKTVGYGNFNLLSYEKALWCTRNYSFVGEFTRDEFTLMEKLFYENPYQYGFYGEKTSEYIDNIVSIRDVVKIRGTGHHLYKGKALEDYKKLKKDVGDNLTLTSGVRNVMKQMNLYTAKLISCKGNITKASISIAPPAYSYHTISDFDVGRKDWGYSNFTEKFATTDEFKIMSKLDYIGMRYNKNNTEGVRFEPWHVEVI